MKIIKIPFKIIVIFCLLIQFQLLNATIYIQFKAIGSYTVDATNYPELKTYIKAANDVSNITLDLKNLIIVENNRHITPNVISAADNDGWQLVKWTTSGILNNKSNNHIFFYVTYQNETASNNATCYFQTAPRIMLVDLKYQSIDYINYGNLNPNSSSNYYFYVDPLTARVQNNHELALRVDSLKINSNQFSITWLGNADNKQPPPTSLTSGLFYLMGIYCNPTSSDYLRAKFTLYYEKGLKTELPLICNKFKIPFNSSIVVQQPNGGEILAPCQDYTIKWTGSNNDFPSIVEYSTNGGSLWKSITKVFGDSCVWRVPNEPTNRALVRVRQELQSSSQTMLRVDTYPVRKVCFSPDAKSLLSVNDAGLINSWDVNNNTFITSYILENVNFPFETIQAIGMDFINNDTFLVAYNYNNATKLAYFRADSVNPFQVINLNDNGTFNNMFIDNLKQMLIFTGNDDCKLSIYDALTGNFKYFKNFDKPISAFSANKSRNEAALAFISGDVVKLNLPDFTIKDTIDLKEFPIITELGLSPDGNYMGISCRPPTPITYGSQNMPNAVVYLPSKQIVRESYANASESVGIDFSASSSFMAIGSKFQPQIMVWDLPNDYQNTSLSGHAGEMTDIKFSPAGDMLATSSISDDNLYLRRFTYPQSDVSDSTFEIKIPSYKIVTQILDTVLIATEKDYTIQNIICNTGKVPIYVNYSYFAKNRNFKQIDGVSPVTILPGECASVKFAFIPIDTGKITDSLVIYTCLGDVFVPIVAYGKNRNIELSSGDTLNFGEICVGSTIEKTFTVATNKDTVPLFVNQVKFSNIQFDFKILYAPKDTILKPGESIVLTIQFSPKGLGNLTGTISILHSNLPAYTVYITCKGVGLGNELTFDRNDIRFIPEIPDRTLNIKNESPNIVTIDSITINPNNIFTVSNPIPIILEPDSSIVLNIHWNGTSTNDLDLVFQTSPCQILKSVKLGMYQGNSMLTIPDVYSDPRSDSAVIPIRFYNTENAGYNGSRFFDAEITINSHLFYPQSIFSGFGIAKITKNEVVNDLRYIGFRIDGIFPIIGTLDTLAEIKGVAGLGEVDTSLIKFNNNSIFWGNAVQVVTQPGVFRLINVCGNRRILQDNQTIKIISLQPNPIVGNSFNLQFATGFDGNVQIDIYDMNGNKLNSKILNNLKSGINSSQITLQSLPSGIYSLVIRLGEFFAQCNFVVIS